MHHILYVKFRICIIVTTSSVGNISLSLPNLWEIHHCLPFDWVQYIMVYSSPVGFTPFSLPTMGEMKYFLHLTFGKLSLSVLLKWEMHHCLYLSYVKRSIVSTSPGENASMSLPHLWEMHQALYLTCEKCIIGSI